MQQQPIDSSDPRDSFLPLYRLGLVLMGPLPPTSSQDLAVIFEGFKKKICLKDKQVECIYMEGFLFSLFFTFCHSDKTTAPAPEINTNGNSSLSVSLLLHLHNILSLICSVFHFSSLCGVNKNASW